MRPIIALTALTTILLMACNNDTGTASTGAGGDLLIGKDWKITALTVTPGIDMGGTVVTDLFAQEDACDKDNIVRFFADGTTTTDEGPSRCDTANPQLVTDKWAINAAGTTLTITANGADHAMTITSLTANQVKLSVTGAGYPDGLNHTIVTTFTAR